MELENSQISHKDSIREQNKKDIDWTEIVATYESVHEILYKKSVLLPENSTIGNLERSGITAWARVYQRNNHKECGEKLSVIFRAMQLVGFTIRPIQLLSVIIALSKEDQKGRLLHINTGEGKRL